MTGTPRPLAPGHGKVDDVLEGAPLVTGLTQLTSAALLTGVGAFSLWVKPRNWVSAGFGVFAFAYGSSLALGNVLFVADVERPTAAVWWDVAANVLTGCAAIGLAIVFPRRFGKDQRWVALVGVLTFVTLVGFLLAARPPGTPDPLLTLRNYTSIFYLAAWRGLLVVLASRFLVSPDSVERRLLALASAALLLDPASRLGASTLRAVRLGNPDVVVGTPATFVVFVALVLCFLVATRGPASHVARNMAILGPLAILVAAVLEALGLPGGSYSRFLMVTVLAYAILRHELLGIVVGIKPGLLRPALAAFLIGAVFVATETVQQLIGERLGNAYVGILATGAVVLAIAPLSRLANRWTVAPDRAGSARGRARPEAEEAYKRAVRLALRDRRLTREEEIHLHEVAEHMGIGAGRAMALRVEVERETEG